MKKFWLIAVLPALCMPQTRAVILAGQDFNSTNAAPVFYNFIDTASNLVINTRRMVITDNSAIKLDERWDLSAGGEDISASLTTGSLFSASVRFKVNALQGGNLSLRVGTGNATSTGKALMILKITPDGALLGRSTNVDLGTTISTGVFYNIIFVANRTTNDVHDYSGTEDVAANHYDIWLDGVRIGGALGDDLTFQTPDLAVVDVFSVRSFGSTTGEYEADDYQIRSGTLLILPDSVNLSGAHFEEFTAAAGLSESNALFSADPDGDRDINIVEFKLASDPTNVVSVGRKWVSFSSDDTLCYRQRISSPGAHVTVHYSDDLNTWHEGQSNLTETARTPLGDGISEEVCVRIDDPVIAGWTKCFARVQVSTELFTPRFAVPPEATTQTTISMTAGEGDLDPRAVEYYFQALSAGAHDSGWQRNRLYTDTALTPDETYAYRVKIRSVDPGTGTPLTESGWSRTASAATPPGGRRPNVIVIMADDVGWEAFPFYGESEYKTPRLQTMVEQGMKFTNFHAQPICTPSRVQIMTGRYNHRNYTQFGDLDANAKTFGNFFRDTGYRTCIAGKWQLSTEDFQQPHNQGFEEYLLWHFNNSDGKGNRYFDPKLFTTTTNGLANQVATSATDYGPDLFTDFVLNFITAHQAEPFFVYYPMALVHNPFNKGTPDAAPAAGKEGFLDMVNYMDKLVGRILDKLDELGLRNDTLVMFSGDNGTNTGITSLFNGENYKGGKGTTQDKGTHVPFVATWPGHIPEASVCDDLADYSDFVTTITDVAGVPLPQDINFDGRSLRSQFLGRSRDPRRWVYCYYDRNGNGNQKVLVRNKQWKLYRSGDGHTRAGNLYDVVNDFGENSPVTPGPGSALEALRDEFQAVLDRLDADSN